MQKLGHCPSHLKTVKTHTLLFVSVFRSILTSFPTLSSSSYIIDFMNWDNFVDQFCGMIYRVLEDFCYSWSGLSVL